MDGCTLDERDPTGAAGFSDLFCFFPRRFPFSNGLPIRLDLGFGAEMTRTLGPDSASVLCI